MTAKEISEKGFTNHTKIEWLDLVSKDYYHNSFKEAVDYGDPYVIKYIVIHAMTYYANQCCRNI